MLIIKQELVLKLVHLAHLLITSLINVLLCVLPVNYTMGTIQHINVFLNALLYHLCMPTT